MSHVPAEEAIWYGLKLSIHFLGIAVILGLTMGAVFSAARGGLFQLAIFEATVGLSISGIWSVGLVYKVAADAVSRGSRT